MGISYFDEVGNEAEKHNEICGMLDGAIKSARKRAAAEMGHDTTVRRLNVKFNSDTYEVYLKFVDKAYYSSSFKDIKQFEEDLYNVFCAIG